MENEEIESIGPIDTPADEPLTEDQQETAQSELAEEQEKIQTELDGLDEHTASDHARAVELEAELVRLQDDPEAASHHIEHTTFAR